MVTLDSQLAEDTFERLVGLVATSSHDDPQVVDASAARWISPAGAVGLALIGEWTRTAFGLRTRLLLPTDRPTLERWTKMGLGRHLPGLFDVDVRQLDLPGLVASSAHGSSPSCVPLGYSDDHLGPAHTDLHAAAFAARLATCLVGGIGLETRAAARLAGNVARVMVHISDNSHARIWYAAESYRWTVQRGRRILILAVGALGYTVREALRERYWDQRSGWDAVEALEAAICRRGLPGFVPEPPFFELRRAAGRMDGKLVLRSGTARIAIVPRWDDDVPMVEDLVDFPGTILTLAVPEGPPEDR